MASESNRKPADWAALGILFNSYLNSDAVATRRLFEDITRVLKGYFYVRMGAGADADDMVQTTLLKIHFARDRYDPEQSLKTWVFTIASRSLIDHWRGNAVDNEHLERRSGTEDPARASELESVPSELLSPEQKTLLHADLNQALLQLKPIERSIVYLYEVEGLSMAEIAEALSLTEGATKLRAHRAYQELRGLLGFLAALILEQWLQGK